MTTYPGGTITTYGMQLLAEGIDPHITYIAPDDVHTFYLSGPLAPMPNCANGLVLQSIQGLHPGFQHIDTRGARQDGVTWTDTVYEPAEIDMELEVTAKTATEFRQVMRDWISSWNPKVPGKLSWWTPEQGEWWTNVRLFKPPPDNIGQSPARHRRQKLTWTARADDAFWRSTDSVSTSAAYRVVDVEDAFARTDVTGLGASWTQTYSGAGAGFCGTDGSRARWYESGTTERTVVNRYVTDSATDNQVITLGLGGLYEFPYPDIGYLDIWGRMGDNAGNDGIRLRISPALITLSRFNSGVETIMKQQVLLITPLWFDDFTLVIGTSATSTRQYQLLRNGFRIFQYTESGTGSLVGAAYRGWGWGMHVGTGIASQKSPASVAHWSAGDNTTITQTGFVTLTNRGTEDAWIRYLVYGPGTFTFGNGSGATGAANPIEFGPLVAGQIALITTHPRLRSVVDLSPDQAPQALSAFQAFIDTLLTLAFNNNTPPLLDFFESLFGIQPPQGELYSLLDGRFTRPIAGHVEGTDLLSEEISISITDGAPESKVVAAITPLRRWPE